MTNSIAVDPVRHTAISTDRLRSLVLAAAAGLMGFGLILFVAANWDALGRFQRFGLVGAVVLAGGIAAMTRSVLQTPGLLLAFAGAGGLLALIGQTYQTGADTWQLFALWAGLTLPWALAARSDALWTPWAIVFVTAFALWLETHGLFATRATNMLGITPASLTSWAMSLGLAAAMGPWHALEPWLGSRRWAFRAALTSSIALIGLHALEAALGVPSASVPAYFIALALLGGIAAWLAFGARRDMLLLAMCALAIDTVLIVGLAKVLWLGSREADFGISLILGLASSGIVAASVMALMHVVRRDRGATAPAEIPAQRALETNARPWPVVVLSGIGAMMAASPLLSALGILLGPMIAKGPATYVVGAVATAGAVYAIRSGRSLFAEQLAVIGLAAGMMLLHWGLFRDLPIGLAGAISGAAMLGLAVAIGRTWLSALLGAAATVGFALALNALLPGPFYMRGPAVFAIVWSVVAAAGIAAALGLGTSGGWLHPLGRGIVHDGNADAATAGWIAAALVGLAIASGMTFLVGAQIGGVGGAGSVEVAMRLIMPARLLSGALAGLACAWAWRDLPSLRTPLAAVVMLTAIVFSLAMPSLGAVVLVSALAVTGQRRVIGVAAVVAALWIIGAFYYSLAMPLTHKAAILAVAGAVLGGVALASGARLPVGGLPIVRGADNAFPVLPHALAVIGLIAVGGVSAHAIRDKEALIRNGAPVFVELAPVDPRSLMQGDYMALRFRLPDAALRHQPIAGERPYAIGKRDGNGVLRLTRIGNAGTQLGTDEMMIELVRKNRQWIIVTDAWYFKEGTAKKWEPARYGELRVLADGRALLVGLADKDRAAIK